MRGSGAAEGMSLVSIVLALLAIAIVGALALYAFRNGAALPSDTASPDTSPGGTINVDVNGGTPQNANPY